MYRFEFCTTHVHICTTTRFVQSYSIDLHWRVVGLHVFLKKSKDEVATLLLISSGTVHRYVDRFWGDIIPQDHRNSPASLLTDFDELTMVNLVLTNPGIYLHEGQVENAETETEVQKRKYGSEKKSRVLVAWLTNVPCRQRVTISKRCESQVLLHRLQRALTQSFSMTQCV